VLVTGVYAAREEAPTGFKMGSYVESMEHPAAHYVDALEAAGDYLVSELQAGDVAIVMSAGDAIKLSERVFNALNQKEPPHA
jgi:UDP-N-acetylmuramate-alanine ligase